MRGTSGSLWEKGVVTFVGARFGCFLGYVLGRPFGSFLGGLLGDRKEILRQGLPVPCFLETILENDEKGHPPL